MRTLLFGSAIVLVSLTAPAAGATGPPPRVALDDSVVVSAPMSVVWRILTDYDDLPSRVPDLVSCRVLGDSAGVAWVEQVGRMPWYTCRRPMRVVMRVETQPPCRISFRAVDGDVEFLEGSWQLARPSDTSRTVVRYHAVAAPPAATPGVLGRALLRGAIHSRLDAIRRCAERLPVGDLSERPSP